VLDQHVIPAAIVLDLDLPQVSGVDVQQEIASHAETRAIPVIVVTGTTWRAPAEVFRTLRKPVNLDTLVSVVQGALEQRPTESAVDDSKSRTPG
jgi:FixJ family two-component response regulator